MGKLNSILRIPSQFYTLMLADLKKPHPFAAERVGFFSTSLITAGEKFKIVLVTGYHSIPDDDYIDDPAVGAKINTKAILTAMQRIISTGKGCLHVHLHEHNGTPSPSSTDLASLPGLARSFLNANSETACGYLILSNNDFFCEMYTLNGQSVKIGQLTIVGYPLKINLSNGKSNYQPIETFSRQIFLGQNSEWLLKNVRIGIVGLGGGGSHIAQQLGHIGIVHFSIFDEDSIEVSNLNRLIGAWFTDVLVKMKKIKIIKRLISKINPRSHIQAFASRWQDHPDELNKCDLVLGCVDSYDERMQLESACRRALIPLIDIGMDVHTIPGGLFSMAGQVILSMPGDACMTCFNFLSEEKLSEEAKKYGKVGGRPQVVWPNGVLASTAVGICIDLISGWAHMKDRKVYLSYDGGRGHVIDHPRGVHCPATCIHYPLEKAGNVAFMRL